MTGVGRHTIRGAVLGLVGGLLAGCSSFDGEVPTGPPPEAVALSEYLPTFAVSADAAAFADMSERYLEDVKIDARVTEWRGGELVLDDARARIQIKGAYSAAFPLKPLGIRLRDAVDNADGRVISPPTLLPGHSLARVRAFRLRNGGNAFTTTLVKDLAYARLLAASPGLNVLPVYGEPAAVYVNDDFYGLVNLRSETNGRAVADLLGVDRDRLQLAELDELDTFEVKEGDPAYFRELETAIAAGDLESLARSVDEASFVDFVLVGTMFAVWDWPWKNVRVYAVDGGPLRFIVYDFDLASVQHVDLGPVEHMRQRRPNPIGRLFEVLYADEGFRERFEARYAQLLDDGTLAPERLRSQVTALAEVLRPVISLQTERHGYPESLPGWELDLERVVEDYEERYVRLEPYD